MIPSAFEYIRVDSADAALAALAEHGDEAKLLAGGHSLVPLLKLRLASPSVVVDIGRLKDLSYINDGGDHIAVGALTRHHDVVNSAMLATHVALLPEVARHVGDAQVRHRGTLGGSIVHGDPGADLPTAAVALGATMVVRGPRGERTVAAADFFQGFLTTAVEADELLTEVRFPKITGAKVNYQKFNRRAQDWAIVGVASWYNPTLGGGIALTNMGSTPIRAHAVEKALTEGASPADAAAHAAEGTSAPSDLNASSEYREHLARVLVRRSIEACS